MSFVCLKEDIKLLLLKYMFEFKGNVAIFTKKNEKYTKYTNNKVLLYSTGNYIQYPIISRSGKEYEEEYMCIYNVSFWCTVN